MYPNFWLLLKYIYIYIDTHMCFSTETYFKNNNNNFNNYFDYFRNAEIFKRPRKVLK